MPNTLRDKIIYLGLSPKKEFFLFFLMNIFLIASVFTLFYLKVQEMLLIIAIVFLPLLDYLYLSRYGDATKKLQEVRNNEFISLLSYFEIFISNHNNVYKSFELLVSYSSEWMKERILNLLDEIDNDKSVTPFINFSNNFTYLVVQNVMISIYQMIEQGESQYALNQFDYLFSSLNETLYHEKVIKREKSLDTLNSFPLIGAGIITILLTFSVMSILGDIANVI